MPYDPLILDEVSNAIEAIRREGKLRPQKELNGYFARFRQEFGPDVLGDLDGEELLQKMHGRSDAHDSLVYWLEFKNDDEFPSVFGSIAGGSAHKFGLYFSSETGEWIRGTFAKREVLPLQDAIEIAREQRRQMMTGAVILEKLSRHADQQDYRKLQEDLEKHAPDVVRAGWVHKYLYLLYPTKLDDIHSEHHQRFHILRLLEMPDETPGRYVLAWHFVELARQLNQPIHTMMAALYHRSGYPYGYWRIGTSDGRQRRNRWDLMKDGGCIAIGWADLGDLSDLAGLQSGKATDQLKTRLAERTNDAPPQIGKNAKQIWSFIGKMAERDIVAAMDGGTVLGIARVTGDYYFEPGEPFPHRRPVDWLSLNEWKMDDPHGLQRTVTALHGKPAVVLQIERRILGREPIAIPAKPDAPKPSDRTHTIPQLKHIPGRIQSVLDRKGQVILYGPPGTGKTYWAEIAARDLAAYDTFGLPFEDITDEQRIEITGSPNGTKLGRVRFCCFHPAYGYEDFLEGYRPEERDGQMIFRLLPGIFRRLCDDAGRDRGHRYYLIIDEINRGDIPRIFGELLTVLEKDKRGKAILLPMTCTALIVPPNVFVIGTMNTADRSIALLDTALRRRFGFVELMPDYTVLRDAVIEGIPLAKWLEALNDRICLHIGRDARNLQIGHSYLLDGRNPISTFTRFARVLRDDLLPLLEEYCYEDYETLQNILQKGLIDRERRRLRDELFDPSRKQELIEAVLQFCPGLVTTTESVEAEDDEIDEDLDESEADEEELQQ